MVPVAALNDRELAAALPVLLRLCVYRDSETNDCFPSLKRLAADLGLSLKRGKGTRHEDGKGRDGEGKIVGLRTVQRHIDTLMRAGFLTISDRADRNGGRQTSNRYTIHFDPLPVSRRQQRKPGATRYVARVDKSGDEGEDKPAGATPHVAPRATRYVAPLTRFTSTRLTQNLTVAAGSNAAVDDCQHEARQDDGAPSCAKAAA